MGARGDSRTSVERTSERELVITRIFDAPARIVFAAWTKSELFMRWWAPQSGGTPLLSCEMDVRTGGSYRVMFGHDAASAFGPFIGRYVEVIPDKRLVWTNEESDNGAITTVTFEDNGDTTLLVMRELYPSKDALDESFIGMEDSTPEQFRQLDDLLATLGASTART